jgi:hypothetical protein
VAGLALSPFGFAVSAAVVDFFVFRRGFIFALEVVTDGVDKVIDSIRIVDVSC